MSFSPGWGRRICPPLTRSIQESNVLNIARPVLL